MSRVSVIIPCFNARPWFEETLLSVRGQNLHDLELIVVDDGSSDGSPGIVEQVYPDAKLVRASNLGPSGARNLGTELSSGEYIQYLDADDLLAPDKLSIQLKALRETGADVAYGDWQKLIASSDGSFVPGEVCKRPISIPEIDLFTGDSWNVIGSYLFRRTICDRVGGWNTSLPIVQDARFVLDCALQGGTFVYCPGVMAFYRTGLPGSVSTCDPIGRVQDCLRNASQVEKLWEESGGIDDRRRDALLRAYGYVARASFEKDRATFKSALSALERLEPGYLPRRPKHLRSASKVLGYRRAEALAEYYRRAKMLLGWHP